VHGVPFRYSLRNLLRRPVRSVLTVLGLSLLVSVIIFLVAFGRSFGRALRMPGDPQNLIVLSKKAQTFEFSAIAASELDLLEGAMEVELQKDPSGLPLLSREIFHFVNIRLDADPEELPRRSVVHGIDPELAEHVLYGFELDSGRLPDEGENEILVGRAVAERVRAPAEMLAIGKKVKIRESEYTVVGTFKAPGTIYENWLMAYPTELRITIARSDYSFARMKVKPGVDMDALPQRVSLDERYQLRLLRETVYFADFKEGFSHFQRFAVLLAVAMAVGGILTGMNTMHNAVVGRIREIGMLRVLGFGKAKIYLAFLTEALLLTGAAGLVGCGVGYLTNGLPVRLPVAATFPVTVDAPALLIGLGSALLMGLLGLVFPMFRALNTPAVEAVRAV